MYTLHRVFCATPWEFELERRAFHDIVGEFNESEAMKHGLLYVPGSLANLRDKRPYEFVVDENVQACRHYILVMGTDWGPPERNFQRDYERALHYLDDPAKAMRDVVCLASTTPDGELQEGMPLPSGKFSNIEEFKQHVRHLLSTWTVVFLKERGQTAAADAAAG